MPRSRPVRPRRWRRFLAWDNLTFYVPWVNLGAIFAVLYPVALATTYLPARRAARVCPAEPLRLR